MAVSVYSDGEKLIGVILNHDNINGETLDLGEAQTFETSFPRGQAA